jgi:hypothetical protein
VHLLTEKYQRWCSDFIEHKSTAFDNPHKILPQSVNKSVHLSTLTYKSMMLNSELLFEPTQHSQESEYKIATMLTDVHRKIQIIFMKIPLSEFPEK